MGSMICDGGLRPASENFSSLEFVESAVAMADALVWSESRGPGDWSEAMIRVERRYGISARLLKDLRHRPPKTIPAHVYARIEAAYRAMCARIIERFSHGAAADAVKEAAPA